MATKKNLPVAKAPSAASRTRRVDDPEARGVRGIAEDAERVGDTGLISDEDLEQIIRDEFEHTSLPNPPVMPGYHLCWLTTTSQYDSMSKRSRLGYTPVRTGELPGFDPSNGQALGGYESFVTCNEMVLCKIPEQRYRILMNYFHHKKPLEDEGTIVTKALSGGGAKSRDAKGRSLVETGDGIDDLERAVSRTPEHGSFS